MFIRFGEFVRNQDAEGAGGDVAATGKQPAGEGDAASKGAVEGDAAATGSRDGIGANSGKTEQDALAELAIDDAMRAKLVGALPETARENGAKWLKTRSSFADLLKAGLGADSKISELNAALKGSIKLPGKDAKPEEVAAYRKAIGVPETADKYAVYRPDGFEATEADTANEQMLVEAAHGLGINQAQLDGVLKVHYAIQGHAQRQQAERAAKAAEAAQEDLRAEYGRDYKANVSLADRWLTEHFGGHMGDEWKGLMGTRFADGTALGEKPGFVKAIVALAKAAYDDGSLIVPESGQDGADPAAKVAEMMKKFGTPEYNKPEFQTELQRWIAAENRMKAAKKAA